jgi:AraC-like DNA-binding protein
MQGTLQKLHKSPQLGARILNGGSHQAAKNVHYPPHHHSYWELVYYRSGAIDCIMAGEKFPGYVGLVWLTPPGVIHAEQALTAYSNYYVALELADDLRWPVFLDDDGDHSVGRLCQQIVIEHKQKPEERRRMLELLAEQLVVLMDRISRERVLSNSARAVARAERLIEEKCGQPLSVVDVAQGVKVSVSALRAYFARERGCSPREHLQQVRLEKAVRFLRTSTLKLEAVAELCGYDSASHLTRSVKRWTGKTPGRIRRG